MFGQLRLKVGLAYAKIHFRRYQDRIMNFTEVLSRARRVLVIFPETPIERASVSSLMKYLIERFSADNIVVLIRHDQLFSISMAPAVKTITYRTDEISRWFIPAKSTLQRISTGTFDVAIDLNAVTALPSAFFCKASNAPLRISFAKQHGDQFYNFQMQAAASAAPGSLYKSLLHCLEMF